MTDVVVPSLLIASIDVVTDVPPETTYAIEQVTDHCAQMDALLLEQFKGKAAIEALLCAPAAEMNGVEAALFDLLELRTLDAATGEQLDGIGRVVGRERLGLDDDDYRLRLRVQVLVNRCSGTVPEILEIVGLLLPSAAVVHVELIQGLMAEFDVYLRGVVATEGEAIAEVVQEVKAGGVKAVTTWWDSETPFGFLDDVGSLGFGAGDFGSAE